MPADPADGPLAELMARIGHRFRRPQSLERALTHSSRANEEGDPAQGNERLEFLGDAVLELVVSELLMERLEEASEGELSRARASLVNTRALARHATRLGFGAHARLGRGEDRSGGRRKPRVLANLFEAVLGALYLDAGLEACRAFVAREFGELLERAGDVPTDAKTALQERLQKGGQVAPSYETLRSSGPDHAREFEVGVRVGGSLLATATGSSKRVAEMRAARSALEQLEEPGD